MASCTQTGRKAGGDMKAMTQHDPDFLYTWRQVSQERRACAPEGYKVKLARVARQEATSEAEALRLWLTDGGDLSLAFLYGLEIVVGDDALDGVRDLICWTPS